jgi:hypothetical protein
VPAACEQIFEYREFRELALRSVEMRFRSRSKPLRKISHVGLYVRKPLRLPQNLVARRFRDKTRAALRKVPVVIREVVKARFGDRATQPIAMCILRAFKRDN